CGIPWSCAAGMKCVPISPLVVAPQIANAPASSQKVPVREAWRSADSARRAAPVRCAGGGGASSAPYGVAPTSRGSSRNKKYTGGTTANAAKPTVSAAARQPCAATRPRTGGEPVEEEVHRDGERDGPGRP